MGKQVVNISQIEKYLNGELDAQAMHRLERQALDDPFLADALEGYQQTAGSQKANLADLQARLKQRTEKREARVIPFRYLSAAASVLILCTVGIWWFSRKDNERNAVKNRPVAANVTQKPATADTGLSAKPVLRSEKVAASARPRPITPAPADIKKPAANASPVLAEKAVVAEQSDKSVAIVSKDGLKKTPAASATDNTSQYGYIAPKDTTPLNEVIAMNYKSSKQKTDTGIFVNKLKEIRIKKPDSTQRLLTAKAPGVKIYPNYSSQADLNKAMAQGQFGSLITDQTKFNPVITGKVINLDNGQPVKGASVQVMGSKQVAKTDAKGYFKLQADTSKNNLVITNPGYRARQVSANSKDSVKMIVLAPNESDTAEDDIAAKGTNKDFPAPYVSAHPQKGWSSYRDYLKANAVSPDGKTGIVKISFSVDKYGNLSNLKVVRGLSDATDKKAISLVKDGPAWAGSTDNKAKTMTLRVKFGK